MRDEVGSLDDSLMIATIRAGYLQTARLLKVSGDQSATKERIETAVVAATAVKISAVVRKPNVLIAERSATTRT
jgi:hypothetical protein